LLLHTGKPHPEIQQQQQQQQTFFFKQQPRILFPRFSDFLVVVKKGENDNRCPNNGIS
jgi:hypothetical protein